MNLFFDLDGTLTDPFVGITSSLQCALQALGLPVPAAASLKFAIGPALRESLGKLVDTPDQIEPALVAYRQRFSTIGLFENTVYEGIPAALAQLQAQQHRLFVVTAKPAPFAEQIVSHFGLAPYFERVVGSALDGSLDDKADIIALLLKEAQLNAAQCVMIGDREHDVRAAKQHGIATIGVTWGYGSQTELTQSGADVLCHQPAALSDALQAHLKPRPVVTQPTATIESLDYEGHGVARVAGKTLFIDGALPGETVEYLSYRKKPHFENAEATRILTASDQRVAPRCPHFEACGGCSMQHFDALAQVAAKQRVLEDQLKRIGKVQAGTLLPPIYGPTWGYRHRARLSTKLVDKKGGLLLGFHEKRSPYVVNIRECAILPPHVSTLLPALQRLIAGWSIVDRVPVIELAVGADVTVLVFRIMDPLSGQDAGQLRAFIDAHQTPDYPLQAWLQTGNSSSARPFYPLAAPSLTYTLPEFGIEMPFLPTEFTQVNPGINQVMVARALRMLDPQPGERIADLFCGLGNFTLPIAKSGATVVGIEGSKALVARAIENAAHNGLSANTQFREANLFEVTPAGVAAWGRFDKMLIDPPRDGAHELVKSLGKQRPGRIVYVSCNPATLARDANILVQQHGYILRSAGVINMFPHTGHVESIALFELPA